MNYQDAVTVTGKVESAVRRWWLPEVNHRCQTFVGMLTSEPKALEIDDVRTFVRALPVAKGPVEEVVLKGILLDLMLRIGTADDVRSSARHRTVSQQLMPRSAVALRIQPGWSNECAGLWAAALAEVSREFAMRSAGLRATEMMHTRYSERWPLSRLARETGANHPHELAASVRRQFGITPRQYLERVRLDQAILRVRRGDKIEFIPEEVGYGSRKNMNGAFTRVLGLRPSEVRSLSEKDIEIVRQRIARVLHPVRRTPDRPGERSHSTSGRSTRRRGAPSTDQHLESCRFAAR